MSEPIDKPGWQAPPLRFDPERPIAAEVLAQILQAATMARSPYNLQPWRFLVVREAASRRKLQACAWNQPLVGQAPVVVMVLGYHDPERSHIDAMLTRRIELGACTPEQAAEIRGRAVAALGRVKDRAPWATRSAMLAASSLMRAAESLGVSTVLLDEFDAESLRTTFGVPDDHTICCLVALGWADQAEPFPGRFGLEEVCYVEHFGRPWEV